VTRTLCYNAAQDDPKGVSVFAHELNSGCPQVNRRYERGIIKEEGLEPDVVKRGCSYYGEAKIEIIKQKLKE